MIDSIDVRVSDDGRVEIGLFEGGISGEGGTCVGVVPLEFAKACALHKALVEVLHTAEETQV